jgi:hypothetical protein
MGRSAANCCAAPGNAKNTTIPPVFKTKTADAFLPLNDGKVASPQKSRDDQT